MDDFGYLLMNSAKKLRHDLNQALEKHDVTSAQWAILKHLQLLENHQVTSALLSERLGFDKPTTSGIISRLEKKGFLVKHASTQDKRSFSLKLTPQAYKIIPQLESSSQEVTSSFLSTYTPEEQRLFVDLLKKKLERND
ncbi:MarR family winged helix-turn-helix transcriptional regulator [Listeria grandensis]|uniref:MarR family winged helix-turn-helix transcriptional regulator n=1 Tax=Listeria grandensis TaxID=1494963 RepID=UPI00164D8592|nr:MarR family transcriptional regulator [Listeria grandensis]MBC6315932.1 MarR family transcriptional regulator [Listeria grandensis]